MSHWKPVTLFDVSRQRVKIAGEVALPDHLPPSSCLIRDKSKGWTGPLDYCCLQRMKHGNNPVGLRQMSLPIVLGDNQRGHGNG